MAKLLCLLVVFTVSHIVEALRVEETGNALEKAANAQENTEHEDDSQENISAPEHEDDSQENISAPEHEDDLENDNYLEIEILFPDGKVRTGKADLKDLTASDLTDLMTDTDMPDLMMMTDLTDMTDLMTDSDMTDMMMIDLTDSDMTDSDLMKDLMTDSDMKDLDLTDMIDLMTDFAKCLGLSGEDSKSILEFARRSSQSAGKESGSGLSQRLLRSNLSSGSISGSGRKRSHLAIKRRSRGTSELGRTSVKKLPVERNSKSLREELESVPEAVPHVSVN